MKANRTRGASRGAITSLLLGAVLLFDVAIVSEADAVFGTRRRTALVTAAVVHESDEQKAAAAQPPPPDEQAPAPAPQTPPAAQTPPPAANAGAALPQGTVVTSLPAGCKSEAVEGVTYYECGPNKYRAAFQGSNLVYVTVAP